MINVHMSMPNDTYQSFSQIQSTVKHSVMQTRCHYERRSTNWKKKKQNKTGAHCCLLFPTLWNNFFHSQDDLSWQIGSSGCLASWPRKVHFPTPVSSSCWQANATNQCNKSSEGFRIRIGNCNNSRIIRCEVCPTLKTWSYLQKRTNSSLEGG